MVGYYPDLTLVCDALETHARDPHAIVNPKLLVEMTSKSTERRDRGIKLEDYRGIDSLEGYLIVSHSRPELEYWFREPRGIVSKGSDGNSTSKSASPLRTS